MAQLPSVFKASQAEDATFKSLPSAWYRAKIVKSEVKSTKAKDGKYIAFTFRIISGKYKKRLVFTNLNIINKNETAVRIAESDLKKICEACGVDEMEDTSEVHDIELGIKLTIKAATAQYPEGNEIKDYSDASELLEEEEGDEDDSNPFGGFGSSEGDKSTVNSGTEENPV